MAATVSGPPTVHTKALVSSGDCWAHHYAATGVPHDIFFPRKCSQRSVCASSAAHFQISHLLSALLRMAPLPQHCILDSGFVRGLDLTNRPQCSSFRVIVAGLSLGDVVEVGVGKKEVEDKREGE